MYAAGYTDVGVVRSENQDSIFASVVRVGPVPNLFIVADGMGGHNAGDVASRQAVGTMSSYVRNFPAADFVKPPDYLDLLINAAKKANEHILSLASQNPSMTGMGTTLTACVIVSDSIFIAHVGDSRAYSLGYEGITQLTSDHTYVAGLILAGKVTPEEALSHPRRHVLTRVLGDRDHSQLDKIVVPLGGADSILLCSDGLTNMIDNDTILQIVSGHETAEERAQILIDEANERGGDDNISAIIIDLKK